jgi:hypothetical protein
MKVYPAEFRVHGVEKNNASVLWHNNPRNIKICHRCVIIHDMSKEANFEILKWLYDRNLQNVEFFITRDDTPVRVFRFWSSEEAVMFLMKFSHYTAK